MNVRSNFKHIFLYPTAYTQCIPAEKMLFIIFNLFIIFGIHKATSWEGRSELFYLGTARTPATVFNEIYKAFFLVINGLLFTYLYFFDISFLVSPDYHFHIVFCFKECNFWLGTASNSTTFSLHWIFFGGDGTGLNNMLHF